MAGDLRQISAALKMITDMERIGDQALDIAETAGFMGELTRPTRELFKRLAETVVAMVTDSGTPTSAGDLLPRGAVARRDDEGRQRVQGDKERHDRAALQTAGDGEYALDLLMIAKIPRAHRATTPQTLQSGWSSRPRATIKAGGLVMIYCVEDDASIRDIEVYALRSTGFEAEGVRAAPRSLPRSKEFRRTHHPGRHAPGRGRADILKSSASAPPRGTSPSSWRRRAARNTTR